MNLRQVLPYWESGEGAIEHLRKLPGMKSLHVYTSNSSWYKIDGEYLDEVIEITCLDDPITPLLDRINFIKTEKLGNLK